jgi:pimeloyl-ACP methyl ester carboxylesterase
VTDRDIRTVFIETGGLRFEVMACGSDAGGRLALCLHGFPEHAFSWRHQLPLLGRLGYLAWAPNQRGYGLTSRPPRVRDYGIDHLVADVGQLIDASGCREVLLVGHDWGGIVAWYAALRRVRPIDRLVVMNIPHPTRFREALRHDPRQRRRSRYILLFQLPWLPEWFLTRRGARAIGEAFRGMAVDKSRFPEEVLAVYRRNALQPGAMRAMLNWYRAAGRTLGLAEEAPVLEVPTLVIWGEEDTALGVELLDGTERLVKDLTVRRLPGVSHWVQQEAPEKVDAILEAWLTGREVPSFS